MRAANVEERTAKKSFKIDLTHQFDGLGHAYLVLKESRFSGERGSLHSEKRTGLGL